MVVELDSKKRSVMSPSCKVILLSPEEYETEYVAVVLGSVDIMERWSYLK